MMSKAERLLIILLRVAVGWYLLYQGIFTFMTPGWTLSTHIGNSEIFSQFYSSVISSDMFFYANYFVKISFILSGILVLTGLFLRIGALLGLALMVFLYFPTVSLQFALREFYIVNNYLVIALVLMYLFVIRAGDYFGLGRFIHSRRHY